MVSLSQLYTTLQLQRLDPYRWSTFLIFNCWVAQCLTFSNPCLSFLELFPFWFIFEGVWSVESTRSKLPYFGFCQNFFYWKMYIFLRHFTRNSYTVTLLDLEMVPHTVAQEIWSHRMKNALIIGMYVMKGRGIKYGSQPAHDVIYTL